MEEKLDVTVLRDFAERMHFQWLEPYQSVFGVYEGYSFYLSKKKLEKKEVFLMQFSVGMTVEDEENGELLSYGFTDESEVLKKLGHVSFFDFLEPDIVYAVEEVYSGEGMVDYLELVLLHFVGAFKEAGLKNISWNDDEGSTDAYMLGGEVRLLNTSDFQEVLERHEKELIKKEEQELKGETIWMGLLGALGAAVLLMIVGLIISYFKGMSGIIVLAFSSSTISYFYKRFANKFSVVGLLVSCLLVIVLAYIFLEAQFVFDLAKAQHLQLEVAFDQVQNRHQDPVFLETYSYYTKLLLFALPAVISIAVEIISFRENLKKEKEELIYEKISH